MSDPKQRIAVITFHDDKAQPSVVNFGMQSSSDSEMLAYIARNFAAHQIKQVRCCSVDSEVDNDTTLAMLARTTARSTS